MPHFVIDCSENVLKLNSPEKTLLTVHQCATKSGLFDESDIKVRLNPFKENYIVGGKQQDFIHVFSNIMEGRTTDQKNQLSKLIIKELKVIFPTIGFIAVNIRDFEKSTYFNKTMV
ncbi:5-carboxymethyl-2-hydroxymuconate Delta-isomerase [uncultured Psychroserpens sp.]|uniref:5-carboxymethyl-2-hydroxymuconate Delta-isomerase n=1 Tax=uncultured Psychroserpens sp. TaxID=255436 RepID=UPI00261D33CA|nr:5-carboxymethyl-2-hydroxymuconate Delta-isomerase [uncultured Psychroserpens sp.]